LEEPPDKASFTLIELEATESVAMVSCRKYLPENSVNILSAFGEYLDRVIRQCRTSADPREREFAELKANLSKVDQVTLTTAGALRSSTAFVEELPLIDQPKIAISPPLVNDDRQANECVFQGVLRLDQQKAYALARCLMILDAVLRGRDHSNATFQAWRGEAVSQPLKRLLTDNNGSYPALRGFILVRPSTGLSLDFEKVLSELIEIWSADRNKEFDLEQTRALISRYFQVAWRIRGHEQMASIFEAARKHVVEATI
jgi:hypothetical protein